ncbi:MAG: hypothetical protein EHM70_23835 [Chloroflexota bacterium]|nr:MAG: hypothetical protein EHM70_23835 [Chloroflexota bacterium]
MTTTALQLPASFSDVFGMGAPVEVYPVTRKSKWGSAIAALVFLGGAGVAFLFGIWYTYDVYQQNGPAMIVNALIGPLVFAVIFFIIGLVGLWSLYVNWRKSVVIYQNGFAYSDHKGVKAWRWDEFQSIRAAVTKHYTNGIYTGTTHVYTLDKQDGERIVINDSISKVEEVAGKIREAIFPQMYQRYSAAYNSGQPVAFGPVILSRADGIQSGKKSYPWAEVSAVKIERGYIQVAKKGGGWFSGTSIPAASVPNVEIMLSIIDQIIGLGVKK